MTWCSLRVVGYQGHKHGYVWAPCRRIFGFHAAKAELQAPVGSSTWAQAELPVLFQSLLAARGWRAALTCPAHRLCCRQVTDLQNKADKPCLELGSALSLQALLWKALLGFGNVASEPKLRKIVNLLTFYSAVQLADNYLCLTHLLLMGHYSLHSWGKPRPSVVYSNLGCSSSKSLGWGPFTQSPWVSSFYTNFKLDLTLLTLAEIQWHGHKQGAKLWTDTVLVPLRSTKTLRYLEQFATSILAPSQLRPPQRGRGLSHERDLHMQEPVLSPSECSHSCHGDQGPSLPFVVRFFT